MANQGNHSAFSTGNSSDFVSLTDLLNLVRRNLVGLICLPLAAALLGLYFALSQTPIYRATAWMQLDPKPVKAVSELNEVYDPGYDSYQYYVTQSLILTSRKLAVRLVERMDLLEVEEFNHQGAAPLYSIHTSLAALPFVAAPPPPPEATDEEVFERVLKRTRKAISVELAPGSTLFKVNFDSEDPQLAADAANALADLYIEELLEARLEIYRKATSWLTEKLGNISGSLKSSENKLQDFRDQADVVNVGGARGLLEEELRDLSSRLREAQRETTQLESTYREIRRAGGDAQALTQVSALLLDPVINEVTERYLTAKNQLDTLEKRYGKRHPKMSEARATMENARRSYLAQLQIKARSIESQYNIAKRNQQQLESQVARVRSRLKNLDGKQFELNQLQREVTSNQQLYDLFLSRFKETQSSSSSTEINARIADPAFPPRSKFKPEIKKIMVIAGAVGLILALLIILLRELLNTRVETVDELEHITHQPVIGVVPAVTPARKLDRSAHYLAEDAKSPFAESVRSIKTAISLSGQDEAMRCLVITSTEPSEGKTTLSASLAAAMASNHPTLLIDTDMRRSRIASQFGLKRRRDRKGLSQVLSAQCSLDEALIADEKTGVRVLPAGAVPANPALLLDSRAFRELIAYARKHYRYVIIDTPPLAASSDALHLAPHADAFILVSRSQKTHKRALQNSLRQLAMVKAPLFGVILNGMSYKRSGAYYGYGYYGYRY